MRSPAGGSSPTTGSGGRRRRGSSSSRRGGRALSPFVVVSLGTNDPPEDVAAFRADVARVLELAGPDRCVVWATIWRDGAPNDAFNAVLREAASANRRVRLVDWAEMVAEHPDWLADDGLHGNETGYRERAGAIAEAVRSLRARADADAEMTRHRRSCATGADARLRNEAAPAAVVLFNGGTAKAVPGTWSATSELLATELAPRFPGLAFAEVRYRIKTGTGSTRAWRTRARRSISVARRLAARRLLDGRGCLDRASPGTGGCRRARPRAVDPGRAPARRPAGEAAGRPPRRLGPVPAGDPGRQPGELAEGLRARAALGVEGTYRSIPRGLHGAAVRRRSGGSCACRAAGAWVEGVGERLELFEALSSRRGARVSYRPLPAMP